MTLPDLKVDFSSNSTLFISSLSLEQDSKRLSLTTDFDSTEASNGRCFLMLYRVSFVAVAVNPSNSGFSLKVEMIACNFK
jgi:hypothetical protein